MAKIEANLNNVKDIEVLPTGTYSVVINSEPKIIESREKKTPGMEIEFTCTDPGTEIAPGVPRTIKHTIWRSEKMGWEHFKMKELCEACRVSLENPDTADFVGVELKLAISQETYKSTKHGDDRIRNTVDYFLAP